MRSNLILSHCSQVQYNPLKQGLSSAAKCVSSLTALENRMCSAFSTLSLHSGLRQKSCDSYSYGLPLAFYIISQLQSVLM